MHHAGRGWVVTLGTTVTLAATLTACGAKSTTTPVPSPTAATAVPASSMDACFELRGTTVASDYLGRSEDAAKALAATRSEHLELVGADGRCLAPPQVPYGGPAVTVRIATVNDKVVIARSMRPAVLQ